MRFAFFPYLSIRRKISLSLSLVRYCFLSVRKKEKRSKEKREKGRKERIASKHLASARKSNFLRVLPPPALILPLLTRSTILTPIFFLLFFSLSLFLLSSLLIDRGSNRVAIARESSVGSFRRLRCVENDP